MSDDTHVLHIHPTHLTYITHNDTHILHTYSIHILHIFTNVPYTPTHTHTYPRHSTHTLHIHIHMTRQIRSAFCGAHQIILREKKLYKPYFFLIYKEKSIFYDDNHEIFDENSFHPVECIKLCNFLET